MDNTITLVCHILNKVIISGSIRDTNSSWQGSKCPCSLIDVLAYLDVAEQTPDIVTLLGNVVDGALLSICSVFGSDFKYIS